MEEVKEIIDILDSFFELTDLCIDRQQTNQEIIRLIDKSTKVRINLFWEDISYCLFKTEDTDFCRIRKTLKNEASISRMFQYISSQCLYSDGNRENFKLWGSENRSFRNQIIQGFHKYKEKYAEFIVEFNDVYINENMMSNEDLEQYLIYNFNIGESKVTISQPSDMFKLIFLQNKTFGDFDQSWEETITIKFNNIKKSEMESMLQQTIFLTSLHNSHFITFGESEGRQKQINFKNFSFTRRPIINFPKTPHFEPICFYNAGKNSSPEISFFYFYKVLEFFFLKAKDCLLLEKNFRDGTKKISHIDMLTRLLNFPELKERVCDIADDDFILDIIERKQRKGYIFNGNLADEFAEELYNQRNKIVHSMKASRRLPKILDGRYNNDYEIAKWWDNAIEDVALSCIKYFCYDGYDIANLKY